jgi:MoaA/NifB/PqqE/SkfB family radical SAM enzyme
MSYVIPRPTRTAVIDVGKTCNIKCVFCYYHFQKGAPRWHDFSFLKDQILEARKRGNTFIDITGGEPTRMPGIEEYVDFIHDQGMKVCIITNALTPVEKIKSLIDKVDLWRLSMHGVEAVHDAVTKNSEGRFHQEQFISYLMFNARQFHVNMVLCKETQGCLKAFAEYLGKNRNIVQVNIINFLPHYEWAEKEKAETMIADLRIIEKDVNYFVDFLESHGKGVNIRYYPMCRVRKDLRRVVCNDLQVMFDPWEWDYAAYPKTLDHYKKFGESISLSNEHKGEPCCECKIRNVCGGINKAYHRANDTMVDAILDDESDYFYYYRQYAKTLNNPFDKRID